MTESTIGFSGDAFMGTSDPDPVFQALLAWERSGVERLEAAITARKLYEQFSHAGCQSVVGPPDYRRKWAQESDRLVPGVVAGNGALRRAQAEYDRKFMDYYMLLTELRGTWICV